MHEWWFACGSMLVHSTSFSSVCADRQRYKLKVVVEMAGVSKVETGSRS